MLRGSRSLEKNPTAMLVVAGALRRSDGLWLMHRRPEGKQHGGLWEFPGGKVEDAEKPPEALIRELQEELGITIVIDTPEPVANAEETSPSGLIRILMQLYTSRDWFGEPQALEGGQINWFEPAEIRKLPKPPLDVALAEQLFADLPR